MSRYLSNRIICTEKVFRANEEEFKLRGYTTRYLDDVDRYEVLFYTSRFYPIEEILQTITEYKDGIVWYVCDEDDIYVSKFYIENDSVVEDVIPLENNYPYWVLYYEHYNDRFEPADRILWYYNFDICKWYRWECDDFLERYKDEGSYSSDYESFKRRVIDNDNEEIEKQRQFNRFLVEHKLREYIGNLVDITCSDGKKYFGHLSSSEYDASACAYYVTVDTVRASSVICEERIDMITLAPMSGGELNMMIREVRELLSQKYILWDNGVLTCKSSKFPVVKVERDGEKIRVDYCKDLETADIACSEYYQNYQRASMIADSIDSKIKSLVKEEKRSGIISLFKRR